MDKKKLLVLTPRLPYPMIGGDRRRIFTICQALSKEFDITLLSLCENKAELTMPLPDDGVFRYIERVYLPKWKSFANSLAALPTSRALQVAYYKCREFQVALERLAPRHDLILAHLIRTGAYVESLEMPKLLEMTDAISLNYQRLSELKGRKFSVKNLVYRIERQRILREELRLAAKFNHSFVVSDVDRRYLVDQMPELDSQICVAPLGIDVQSLDILSFEDIREGKHIAFVGNMGTTQNFDAADWFASRVMPRLLATNPSLKFKIIGVIGEKARAHLESYPGVHVVGRVDCIREALKGCFAAVCPMRFGAGVQTKVLEYMAYGVPVVSTQMGNEGIDAPERVAIIADSPEALARSLIELHASPSLRQDMVASARKFVQERYDGANVSLSIVDKALSII